jgi:uncharacterized protein YajQ (UPF0234 family)
MPSFDIGIKADEVEIRNAVQQVQKEIGNRFDFKGTCAAVNFADSKIICLGENEFQLNQINDIVFAKFGKRKVDTRLLKIIETVKVGNDKLKRSVDVQNGLSTEDAKKIVKVIKSSKLKVQASIIGDAIKVSGSKKDTLQQTIDLLKKDFASFPLCFDNFRD